MKFLKLYESWEQGNYFWLIVTKEEYNGEKYYYEEDYWMDSGELIPLSDLQFKEIEKGYKNEKQCLSRIQKITTNGTFYPDQSEVKADELEPVQFFLGGYMVEGDDEINL
jgi:hypothetical protein